MASNDRTDLALIGSYPPPYGGISVHMQRLAARLEAAGISYRLYNTVSPAALPTAVVSVTERKTAWFARFLLSDRYRLVHLQSTSWPARLLFGLRAAVPLGRHMISIHGRSISVALGSPARARATRWMLARMDGVIACNQDIERQLLEEVGLPRHRVHMIPAFIPPLPQEIVPPPPDLQAFIDAHRPVLCATGWIGQRLAGADIYGIDLLLGLVERLQTDFPSIGLVLSVNGGEPGEVQRTIAEAWERSGDRIRFLTEPLPDITGVYRACDIFLRPTNTDGDAVSIREALHVGTPVVASDAAPRPAPCLLFRSRDADSLVGRVRQVLADPEAAGHRIADWRPPDNAAALIDIYREFLK